MFAYKTKNATVVTVTFMLSIGITYLPGPLPAKYCRHK